MNIDVKEPAYSAAVLAPDNYSYRERQWRRPTVNESEVILFDEPGRVLPRGNARDSGVCCRAYYFLVTKPEYGQYRLLVKHGGGEESWNLDYDPRIIDALFSLESDARFRVLFVIMQAHQTGELFGSNKAEHKWRTAAAEKRIKTRKTKAGVKVWIITKVS